MLNQQDNLPRFLHLENPIRQPMRDVITVMAREVQGPEYVLSRAAGTLLPFEEWMQRALQTPDAISGSLEGFFRDHFQDLAQGTVVLDTTRARGVSKTLKSQGAVGKEVLEDYVRRWRRDGFLA